MQILVDLLCIHVIHNNIFTPLPHNKITMPQIRPIWRIHHICTSEIQINHQIHAILQVKRGALCNWNRDLRLGTRRCCDVEATSKTLLQRRNNVVCPLGWYEHFYNNAYLRSRQRRSQSERSCCRGWSRRRRTGGRTVRLAACSLKWQRHTWSGDDIRLLTLSTTMTPTARGPSLDVRIWRL